jgi:hypothetical protein
VRGQCPWRARLAEDHEIGLSTAYRYVHESINTFAAQAPDLHTALEQASAGISHLSLDGVLIPIDRCKSPGPPTKNVDLWWSGKHRRHGGNTPSSYRSRR